MIRAYLEGKLDHEEMHRLEKQALTDPFLWEALEGYTHTSNPGTDLSILQRQLQERIVHLQENKKVFDFTWQRLSVAASASVLFITAGILFWMNFNRSGTLTEKQLQVALIDRDSLKNEIEGSPNRPVIREKEYPVSSDETRITAYKSPSGANNESELNSSPSSTGTEISSGGASIPVTKLSVPEQRSASRSLASSEGINASEQAVQPVPGWDIYRKYLEDNIRKPATDPNISGSVLLSFELDDKGKPVNLHILKGLTEACDAEAIRLIKDGPAWKTRAGSKINTGRIEIRF
ncbi:hypothetical protein [Daejeonella sp.]|uniref:energy transducer TonB n=1 Tax=Daejeonella sp. TaxID=2805397 RepID=UPI00267C22F1|nr:hypothetical protein [Daejeonella sp.]HQS06248.1 hypothetical protein [Daejeonella sp.]HQT21907.1 hypothetical protein [Daejeonella sp.]HQT57214.1 hypothetical protein [Daejeonella sp.]